MNKKKIIINNVEVECEYYYLENEKLNEISIKKYCELIHSLIKENSNFNHITAKHYSLLFENIDIYLSNEVMKIIKDNLNLNISEKYSEYVTFLFFKNKNILKKKFKEVFIKLKEEIDKTDGGEVMNIQFKNFNLILFIHKNI